MSQLVLLTSEGELGENFAALLQQNYPEIAVIFEKPVTEQEINTHRLKRLGKGYILSEKLAGFLRKIIGRLFKKHRIMQEKSLNLPPFQPKNTYFVQSVNDETSIDLLKKLEPKAIAVFSTRILKPSTLNALKTPFINYHCGINPLYRGQYPLYWAKAHGDVENVGVTIHMLDEGVDTGDILYQEKITLSNKTISSFHFKQALPIGARLMTKAINDALNNKLSPYKREGKSQRFYPPTLKQYLFYGLTKNIW